MLETTYCFAGKKETIACNQIKRSDKKTYDRNSKT